MLDNLNLFISLGSKISSSIHQIGKVIRQAKLIGNDTMAGDKFGISVGISESYAVVPCHQPPAPLRRRLPSWRFFDIVGGACPKILFGGNWRII